MMVSKVHRAPVILTKGCLFRSYEIVCYHLFPSVETHRTYRVKGGSVKIAFDG